MKWMFLLSVLAAPALADCPPSPDIAEDEAALLAEVQAASGPAEAQAIQQRLWMLWSTAPDEVAQELLDRGMEARASYDFLGAIDAFDRLIGYCPEYAEGFNQRAFVNFLREDFAAALPDLERALDLSPNHVGAYSGKALTLMGLGRQDEAQIILREALELNPWIPERGLLRKPAGQDL